MRTSTRQTKNTRSVETNKNPMTPRRPGVFYAVIPSYSKLTSEQRTSVDAGGPYPVDLREHLVEHEAFADFLIDTTVKKFESRRASTHDAYEASVLVSEGRVQR